MHSIKNYFTKINKTNQSNVVLDDNRKAEKRNGNFVRCETATSSYRPNNKKINIAQSKNIDDTTQELIHKWFPSDAQEIISSWNFLEGIRHKFKILFYSIYHLNG